MSEKIRLEHITKIFGPTPKQTPLALLQAGRSKDDILQETGHIVGLADVSFQVQTGEIFVVMGLSGSGKSTLIRTVNRLVDPTAGQIYIDDEEITTANKNRLQDLRRTKMSMVFQHFGLFPHKTVLDNVSYGLRVRGIPDKERQARALETLDMVSLKEWATYYPHNLSGGMQQRVGLARALATDTDVLLMDEAFSALDPLIRRQMQDELLLLQSKLKKTILFITHDLNEALRVGNRIAVMRDGSIVQIGSPVEIVTQPTDPYVADFTQDVDAGRVLNAEFVMQEAQTLQTHDTVQTAMLQMQTTNCQALYVVNQENHITGLVQYQHLQSLAQQGHTNLAEAVQTSYPDVSPSTALVELYNLSASGLPLAVINQQNQLLGTITPQDIVTSLASNDTLLKEPVL